jgi:hypothetical protein
MLFIIRSRLLCFLSALTLAASVSSGSVVPTREFGPCLNSGKPSGMSSRDQHATDWLAHHGVGNFPTAEDDGGVNAVVRHWLRSRFLIDYMSFRLREYIEPKNQNHATSRPLYPGSSGRSLPLKIIDGSGSTAASVAMIRKASRDLYHGLNLHGLAEYRKRHAVDAISTSDSDGRPVSGTMKFSLGLAMKWAGSIIDRTFSTQSPLSRWRDAERVADTARRKDPVCAERARAVDRSVGRLARDMYRVHGEGHRNGFSRLGNV